MVEYMVPYLYESYGNPSNLYDFGKRSLDAIISSKKKIAKLLNCYYDQIVFTSGGSEGDSWILKSSYYKNYNKKIHIITSSIEHHAILNTCKMLENIGVEVTYLPVNKDGVIDLESLKKEIKDNTVLISIMMVNNETGVIQPIKEIVEIAHKKNILVHTDAVQAVGHIKIDVKELDIDFLTLSGHKIYAPKGIGACYIKNKSSIVPLICGGKQEFNLRGGTENVAYIVGLGEAVKNIYENFETQENKIRLISGYFQYKLEEFPIVIHGKNRINSILNICFKDIPGDIMQYELEKRGIYISNGSACTSGIAKTSHVLEAMDIPREESMNSVRFSFGKYNEIEEIDNIIDSIRVIYNKFL